MPEPFKRILTDENGAQWEIIGPKKFTWPSYELTPTAGLKAVKKPSEKKTGWELRKSYIKRGEQIHNERKK